MSTLLLIVGTVLVISLGLGVTMLLLFRSSQVSSPTKTTTLTADALRFRWRYIALPLVMLILSITMVAYFYRLLPTEVAYHFGSDGSPDEWTGRGTIMLWTLLPQCILALLALAITWGIAKLSSTFKQMEGIGINLDTLALVMGNMIGLPQAIFFFTILDIFSYNSYEIRILPLWAIALIIMALGAIILGIFFIRAIRQVRENQ